MIRSDPLEKVAGRRVACVPWELEAGPRLRLKCG